MPNLTRLERAQDICWTKWKSPDGKEVSPLLLTPVTQDDINALLRKGMTPPRPPEVPLDWVHVECVLQGMYMNGKSELGPNEIGDRSCYLAAGVRAQEKYVVIIQEPNDDPVVVVIPPNDVTRDEDGSISTTRDAESANKARGGKVPTYRIVNDVATKVGER